MLVVITAEGTFKDEVQQVRQLFREGLQLLHVRKPSFSKESLREWLANFTKIEQQKMVVHRHLFSEDEFPVKGIHLSEQNQLELNNNSTIDIQKFRQKKLTLSASFHHPQKAETQSVYDYVFLSPVFTSISKKNYKGKEFSLSDTKRPVIALGGITEKKLPLTKKMNYQGVAALGCIWKSENPIKSFKHLQKAYRDVYE